MVRCLLQYSTSQVGTSGIHSNTGTSTGMLDDAQSPFVWPHLFVVQYNNSFLPYCTGTTNRTWNLQHLHPAELPSNYLIWRSAQSSTQHSHLVHNPPGECCHAHTQANEGRELASSKNPRRSLHRLREHQERERGLYQSGWGSQRVHGDKEGCHSLRPATQAYHNFIERIPPKTTHKSKQEHPIATMTA